MPLLTLANIQHSYGSRLILDGATLSIEPGEKIGFVGRNGTGKTTLMRVMLGRLTPDRGTLQVQRGARIGYLSQDPEFNLDDTVRDAAEGAFAELHALHVELNELFEQMSSAEGEALDRLLRKQARLEGRMEAAGGYAIDHRIDATLHGLGFTDDQFGQRVGSLSGGQKGRLGLARLLLESPDLLLLDEPTNHLDIDGRIWLEEFLAAEYPGAVLVVSHDRRLLDRVVHRIVEVDRGVILEYPGNYQAFVELRRERQLTQARVWDKQQDRIRQERQFIDRYRAGQRARQAKGRESRLDRFIRDEVIERPLELDVMRLQLPKAPRSGDQVVSVQGLTKGFGDLVLFRDLDLTISRGDRIGIIGPNGAGKTTLVRCLLGEIEPDAGEVRLGSRLSIGYFSQTHERIDLSLTVWQYLQSVIVSLDGGARASEQQARDLAGAFLFSGIEQDKTLADVSGGERSRAVLAGLVAGAHNLLVLDEPSNHLDIPSAERLEQALSADGGYDGTVLLITHDRALLDSVCTSLLILDGHGTVRSFTGNWSEWEARRQAEAKAEEDARSRAPRPARRPAAAPTAGAAPRSPRDPLDRLTLEEIESRIAGVVDERARIDRDLADPAVCRDHERSRSLARRRDELERTREALEGAWLRRAEQQSDAP
ncbi:MAG: ABC-F family ATP-binding cassette domain-containing protein [Phycisphaeraceae bacterium]|nr:ABC-F family ATP-binding cassette domain-containing protein [Phycisphaeraceae bacterium]